GERRRELEQPRQAERQKVAALRRGERMQFVEHHAPERAEQIGCIGRRQQQRQLLRRRQQYVGRVAALSLSFRGRRVAGARLELHGKAHLAHRDFQVARDVDGERLERRNVEGVQASYRATSNARSLPPCVSSLTSPACGGGRRAQRGGRGRFLTVPWPPP